MAKYIELKEAAERLGISSEELTEMRSRNEIFGYRDGASWKFKPEEIERVAGELNVGEAAGDSDAGGDLSSEGDDELIDVAELKLDDESDDGDSILVSEEELGRSEEGTSSTIIGKAGHKAAAADSDIKLADDGLTDEGAAASAGDSDLSLADDDDVLSTDSDLLSLDDGGTAGGAGSDVALDDAAGSDAKTDEGLSLDDDDLRLDDDSRGGSDLGAIDSSVDLDLDDEEPAPSGSGSGSGSGSDLTLGASDSGINLNNPSDSGISLEDADVGSGIDSSLELGDDDMLELESESASPEDATEMQADDEFLLTPVAGDAELDEESDDSGSQVIAIEDEFDESAATLVSEDSPLVAEETDLAGEEGAAAPGAAAATVTTAPTVEEGDFSAWNIVGLAMVAIFMAFSGLLVMDLMRSIWSWNQPFGLNSAIMDMLTQR